MCVVVNDDNMIIYIMYLNKKVCCQINGCCHNKKNEK